MKRKKKKGKINKRNGKRKCKKNWSKQKGK